MEVLYKGEALRKNCVDEISAALMSIRGRGGRHISRHELITLLSTSGEKMSATELHSVLSQVGFASDNIVMDDLIRLLSSVL